MAAGRLVMMKWVREGYPNRRQRLVTRVPGHRRTRCRTTCSYRAVRCTADVRATISKRRRLEPRHRPHQPCGRLADTRACTAPSAAAPEAPGPLAEAAGTSFSGASRLIASLWPDAAHKGAEARLREVQAYLDMARLVNVLPSILLVLVGAACAAQSVAALAVPRVWAIALASAAISVSSVVVNDYFDFKAGVDVANAPEKPLPRSAAPLHAPRLHRIA
jgi:hypothetical protein